MIEILTTYGNIMATDADWGRLYAFDGAGDTGLIMPFRSYYIRDFISGGWQDIALGCIIAACGNTGDYSALVLERQTEDAAANLPHLGLTKSESNSVDVANNQVFLGLRGIIGSVTQIMSSPDQIAYVQATMVKDGQTQTAGVAQILPLSDGTDTTKFVMWGLRFTYNAQTQTVYVNFATQSNVSLSVDTDDITALNPFLQGISNSPTDAIASFSVANVSDFSTFYIYWPYLTNKLKLHCIGLVKLG